MSSAKGKLRIFLADLSHTGIRVATESFPLNVGFLASYLLKRFGTSIDVRLFKYPEKLLHALKHDGCDVLGCSTYIWNNNLGEWAFETARKYNPDVVTIRGGWNLPLQGNHQEEYLRQHPNTDIFCVNEGEVVLGGVIERLLSVENVKGWNYVPIPGTIFLNRSQGGVFTSGGIVPRIENLDEIPSPYTTGLLDEFFDGNLTPMLETTRGCPFKCNYCNNFADYYNMVRAFSTDYVVEEIKYIAKRSDAVGVRNLTLADTNFGMYARDQDLAKALHESQEKYKWPMGVIVSTGKNNIPRIMDTTDYVGNSIIISMSVQSMNLPTLKAIHRDNINLKSYEEISKAMEVRKRTQMAELIVPLPEESLVSYMEGIEKLINIGAKKIISYTLQLNNGTVYKNEDYRKKYGYVGKCRLIPYDFGEYDGKKVFDFEEVGIETKSMGFKDYLQVRRFALLTEILFNNSIFLEVFKLLNENDMSNYSYLAYVFENLDKAPKTVREAFQAFIDETTNELKSSWEELVDFYQRQENFSKLKEGEIGGNVIYRHKGIIFGSYMEVWIDFIFDCLADLLAAKIKIDKTLTGKIGAIKIYEKAKLNGVFSSRATSVDIVSGMHYDILDWMADDNGARLESFAATGSNLKYRYFFNESQKAERNDLFARYGEDSSGVAKIMARVPLLERIFRSVEKTIST